MNARVEAARAGAAGAGFSIIRELTRLSDNISSAASRMLDQSST